MKYVLLLLPLFILSQPPSDFERARSIFFSYHTGLEKIDEAIKILEKVIREEKFEDAYCLISRAYLTKGDMLKSKKERIECYEKGAKWAEEGIKLFEDSACVHFWYSANLGRLSDLKGVLKALSLVPRIRAHFEKSIELEPNNPEFLDGMAMFYVELPKIMGGDVDKGIELLERAIELDPTLTILYLDLGYTYFKKNEFKKAEEVLRKVLEISNPRYYADWYMWDKPKAEELLEEIKKKEKKK